MTRKTPAMTRNFGDEVGSVIDAPSSLTGRKRFRHSSSCGRYHKTWIIQGNLDDTTNLEDKQVDMG